MAGDVVVQGGQQRRVPRGVGAVVHVGGDLAAVAARLRGRRRPPQQPSAGHGVVEEEGPIVGLELEGLQQRLRGGHLGALDVVRGHRPEALAQGLVRGLEAEVRVLVVDDAAVDELRDLRVRGMGEKGDGGAGRRAWGADR